MKIVVFDLDETLGYFTEFGILWDSLNQCLKNDNLPLLTQQDFNHLLDEYPEFLRPNIINILNYLKKKKETGCMNKMMIYTNNNGAKEWVQYIVRYFEYKIHYKLIDQIIAAFKINGQFIEFGRTTHDKTHSDFIRCTKLPANAEICYIDDTFYPAMSNDNVYYINVKPYHYDLPFDVLIERLKKVTFTNAIGTLGNAIGTIGTLGKTDTLNKMDTVDKREIDKVFETRLLTKMNKYNYQYVVKDARDFTLDVFLGENLIHHLHIFFRTKPKTIRRTISKSKHLTRKQKIEYYY